MRNWALVAGAGLVAALMTFAAVFAWHWWFVARHRDRATNDAQRWKMDMVLLRIGFGVLGLLVFGLFAGAAAGLYESWRLDRYGVTGSGTVERIERHKGSATITVAVPADGRVRRIELDANVDRVAVGDSVVIVYDPEPEHTEGVFPEQSRYLRWPVFMLVGALVGLAMLIPGGRRAIKARGLRHWADSTGRIRPPTAAASSTKSQTGASRSSSRFRRRK